MEPTPKNIQAIHHYLKQLQDHVQRTFEALDPHITFVEDIWHHPAGGGGCSRVAQNGQIIEKVGVNFSHIQMPSLPQSASERFPELVGHPFQAMGVSIVIHPNNPYIPTSHANVRFLHVHTTNTTRSSWWFGGGYDLTPYYGFEDDCHHWHHTAFNACQPFGADVYPKYKEACDRYFYLPHRNETRGIGGLFFDTLNIWTFNQCFAFIRAIGDSYLDAYVPIFNQRKNHTFSAKEKAFQNYRRGRYAEFNLLYDRGTRFGLQSNGRIESILMSLPPHAAWHYNWQPKPNSPEAMLAKKFLVPRTWIHLHNL